LNRRGKAGRERAESVEQDAPHEHAPPAEQIGEVTPEQPEDASSHGRHKLDVSDPFVDEGAVRRDAQQLGEPGPHDQRQHQQLVGVEEEADGGNDHDEPLHERES
jgi:hypothetical protein